MKPFHCVAVLLMSAPWALANPSTTPPKVDPILLPISPAQVAEEIDKNYQDADKMVALIRQAGEKGLSQIALQKLADLRILHPENAVIHAAYCMAYDIPVWKQSGFIHHSDEEEEGYKKSLLAAYKLDPTLWLTYMVEGYRLVQDDETYVQEEMRKKGFELLEKSSQLAPQNPYPFYALGKCYDLVGIRESRENAPAWETKAVSAYESALSKQPPLSHAAFGLFQIREFRLQDREKATAAARLFLETLPPKLKLSRSVNEQLVQYGLPPRR